MLLLHHSLALVGLALLASLPGSESKRDCRRLVTYNAVLLPDYGNHTERSIRIPKQLEIEDADVYCLQGYWNECDIEVLVQEVQDKYPHHFSEIHDEVGTVAKNGDPGPAACSQEEWTYFQTTLLKCADKHDCREEFHQSLYHGSYCLSEYCGAELRAPNITVSCYSCIILHVLSFFQEGVTRCIAKEGTCRKQHNPSGLVLLSKWPVKDAEYKPYHPNQVGAIQRGYLHAFVQELGTVVCTELSKDTPVFTGFHDTNQLYNEIFTIITIFGREAHFLMGDLSVGPTVTETNVTGLVSSWYDRLIRSGYSAPYVELDGQCTSCSKDEFNLLTDHVMIKGEFPNKTTITAKRVFDEIQDYRVEGKFGVQVQVCENIDEEKTD